MPNSSIIIIMLVTIVPGAGSHQLQFDLSPAGGRGVVLYLGVQHQVRARHESSVVGAEPAAEPS